MAGHQAIASLSEPTDRELGNQCWTKSVAFSLLLVLDLVYGVGTATWGKIVQQGVLWGKSNSACTKNPTLNPDDQL